jgi:hypothetical protein
VAPVAAFAVAGLAVVACVGLIGANARNTAGIAPWDAASVDATEIESYTSLNEMAAAADAVVRGRIVDVAPGRVFGSDSAVPLHYAAATLRVDEVLRGSLPAADAEQLTLEIPLFDGPAAIDGLRAAAWEESIFFLRNKGVSAREARAPIGVQRTEAQFYRLVVFRAVIVNQGGLATVPAGEGHPFLSALDGFPFVDVVELVRDAAR